jgi:flagellin
MNKSGTGNFAGSALLQGVSEVSLRINTNISSLIALDNLNQTDLGTQNSILRLSTGLRINSGADDPAGLIISQGMQSEMAAMQQAIQNTQNADNMAKTADGALSEVSSLLLDLRGLAVQAGNAAIEGPSALQADQTQVSSILAAIDRVATDTEYSDKKLLDGTAGALANVTDANDVSSIYVGGSFGGSVLQSGPITATAVSAATRALVTLGKSFASANAIITTAGSVVVNGYSVSTSGTETVQSLVSKINAISQTTGVTAQISGNGPVQVVLSNTNYGSQYNVSFFDPSKLISTATSATSTGSDAVYNITASTVAGIKSVLFTGGQGGGVSGLKLTDGSGNDVLLTETGNAAITTVPTSIGQITAGSVQFQVGPDAGQSVSFALPETFARNLGTGVIPGKSLADIDLTTANGAQDAMQIVQAAVAQVATLRGQIGSFQKNVLETGQQYLQTANQNLTASDSNIRDADMAAEMTEFTRLQVLEQSGLAVLAQANQAPQSILTLLKNL